MNEMKWSRRRRKKNADNLYGMPFFGRFFRVKIQLATPSISRVPRHRPVKPGPPFCYCCRNCVRTRWCFHFSLHADNFSKSKTLRRRDEVRREMVEAHTFRCIFNSNLICISEIGLCVVVTQYVICVHLSIQIGIHIAFCMHSLQLRVRNFQLLRLINIKYLMRDFYFTLDRSFDAGTRMNE